MIAYGVKLVATAAPSPAGTKLNCSHNDYLGTHQAFTDQNQNVVWQADCRPFGEVSESVTIFANNLRFAGQYFDGETGLHCNTLGIMIRGLGGTCRVIRLGWVPG